MPSGVPMVLPPPPMPPTTLAACSMPTMIFQRTLLPPSAAAEPASAVASNALAATLANAAGAQILPFVVMAFPLGNYESFAPPIARPRGGDVKSQRRDER